MKQFFKLRTELIVDGKCIDSVDQMVWHLYEEPPFNIKRVPVEEAKDGLGMIDSWITETFFRSRKYVFDWRIAKRYYLDKHKVEARYEWMVPRHLTVENILKYATAEDAMQYFKDHGMTLCPIMKQ